MTFVLSTFERKNFFGMYYNAMHQARNLTVHKLDHCIEQSHLFSLNLFWLVFFHSIVSFCRWTYWWVFYIFLDAVKLIVLSRAGSVSAFDAGVNLQIFFSYFSSRFGCSKNLSCRFRFLYLCTVVLLNFHYSSSILMYHDVDMHAGRCATRVADLAGECNIAPQ